MTSYHAWTHMPKEQGGTDPIPGVDAGVSWGRGNARVTGSAIDYVEPNFTSDPHSEFEQTSDGIFSLDGDERLVLPAGNPGTYFVGVNVHDVVGDAGSDTLVKVLLNLVAPEPTGAYWLPGFYDNSIDASAITMVFPVLIDSTGTNFDFTSIAKPWWAILYMNQSDEDAVFRLRTAILKDNNFDTDSYDVTLSVVRMNTATLDVTIAA